MIQKAKGQAHGFTLVELIIVIVVISILATIAIMSYNGVKDRATAAKAASTLGSYVDILQIYYLNNGAYPVTSGNICLGETSNYPADGTFAAGECVTGGAATVNTTVNNQLKTVSGSTLPDGSLPKTTSPGSPQRGITYQSMSGGQTASIIYFLSGSKQSCGRGTSMYSNGVTTCYINLSQGDISP